MEPAAARGNSAQAATRHTRLDRWFERVLGDHGPQHFGSGWFSGLIGLLLSLGSFCAVLVFQFPEWLTTADLRAGYPVEFMRGALTLAIVAGFFFSALNIILRPSKKLGLAGLFFAALAVIAGGDGVEVDWHGPAPVNLGLDWLVLNVVLLSLVFVPLERLFPHRPEQGTFRAGWTTDGLYFVVSHVLVELLTFFTLLPATVVSQAWQAAALGAQVASLPLWVQVPLIMLVADLTQYWVHRFFHRNRLAWPFHAIHHSSRAMDWLAGSRLHVVDVILTRGLILVPLFVLGFAREALYVWLAIVAAQATFIHVNMRFRFRWIEQLLVTPRFHHWHHAESPIDKNFAVHFPWIDRLFGTYYMPADRWPDEVGIHGDPVPEEFLAQMVWPVRTIAKEGR
ncbi:MAG: sterol desaturase family protein [Rhizobiaceae bacterium]|nr:sterol desaturase family protein [Rhizobiaceae bacterium]